MTNSGRGRTVVALVLALTPAGCGSASSASQDAATASASGGATGTGGGGGVPAGGSGGATGTGGAGGVSPYFITADLDGVTMRAEMDASAYWFNGIFPGYLGLSAVTADGWIWGLIVGNTAANQPCVNPSIQLISPETPAVSYANSTFMEGPCTLQVMVPAPGVGDVIEGHFAATLHAMTANHPDRVATNGSFRLPRTADRD